MYILARLCGAIVQLFNDLVRRKIFSMRGVFFTTDFLWRCGGEDLPQIFTDFFVADFTTDFHSFFMAVGV